MGQTFAICKHIAVRTLVGGIPRAELYHNSAFSRELFAGRLTTALTASQ